MFGSLNLQIIPQHPILSFLIVYLIISFIIYLLRPFIVRLVVTLVRFLTHPITFLYLNLHNWLIRRRINFYLQEWQANLREIQKDAEESFERLTNKLDQLYKRVLDDREFEELNNSFQAVEEKLKSILNNQRDFVQQFSQTNNIKEHKKYLNELDKIFQPIDVLLDDLRNRKGDIQEILQLIKDSQNLKSELKESIEKILHMTEIENELNTLLGIKSTNEYIRQVRKMIPSKEIEDLLSAETATSASDDFNYKKKLRKLLEKNEEIHQSHIPVRAKFQELHDLLLSKYAQWQKKNLFTELMISIILLLVFIAVVYVNYHLLEAPLSDLMPGGFIFEDFRVSHLVAIVLVIMEFISGFLFFEFLGITHLLPGIMQRAKGISRKLLTLLFLILVFVFALTEGYLSYYRTTVLEAEMLPESSVELTPGLSKSPIVMGVVGFFFPLVLSALGVVIDPFLRSVRLILIYIVFFLTEIWIIMLRIFRIILNLIPNLIDKILALIAFVYVYLENIYKKWKAKHEESMETASNH